MDMVPKPYFFMLGGILYDEWVCVKVNRRCGRP